MERLGELIPSLQQHLMGKQARSWAMLLLHCARGHDSRAKPKPSVCGPEWSFPIVTWSFLEQTLKLTWTNPLLFFSTWSWHKWQYNDCGDGMTRGQRSHKAWVWWRVYCPSYSLAALGSSIVLSKGEVWLPFIISLHLPAVKCSYYTPWRWQHRYCCLYLSLLANPSWS